MHMMRRFVCTLTQALALTTLAAISQPSPADTELRSDINRSVWVAHSVTHAGRVRVVISRQRPKFFLAKTLLPRFASDQDDDFYDDLPEVQVGYRRPEVVDQSADLELSDTIKIRLALARIKAMKKYTETWA